MSYSLLSTEILITLLGLLVLIMGLTLADKGKNIIGKVAVLSLLGILIYNIYSFSAQAVLFNGVYQIDIFGNFFKILILTAAVLVLLSSSKYIQRFGSKVGEFYAFMIFAILGMVVMVSAGDIITLYIGLELMAISFYVLTAYLFDNPLSSEAGLKYLLLGAVSSAILLFGISLVYAMAGTTIITEIAAGLTLQPALIAGIILMLAGFAFKIAVVPFHMWAPDVYHGAPMPVTAFLSVASKAASVAAFLRIFIIAVPPIYYDWTMLLAILAAITIVSGNLIALAQTNIKRLLAYSGIAQAGYIMVGAVAYNEYGLKGVLFYCMVYVFANLGAFAVATIVKVDTGSSEISSFAGMGKRSPLMAAVMTICMLSLAGIPPLAGYVGKFYLFVGAIEAGYLWLAFIGLLMSMVSVYYYLNVIKVMYIGETNEENVPVSIGAPAMTVLWVCMVTTIIIGVYPEPLSQIAQTAISLFM